MSEASIFERDERGLVKNIKYIFTSEGLVDWRSMIPSEYLFINRQYEKQIKNKYGKSIEELNPQDIDDKYLLILLGGIKHVLRLRGYRSVKQYVDFVDQYKCVSTCTIEFLPNFETSGESLVFSDTASANLDNTSGTFRLFIETISANRAFVRSVRNALGINITAKDEFDDEANKEYAKTHLTPKDPSEPSDNEASGTLAKHCADLGISFDQIKHRAEDLSKPQTDGVSSIVFKSDPTTWTSFSSILPLDAFFLIEKVNEAAKKKKTKV